LSQSPKNQLKECEHFWVTVVHPLTKAQGKLCTNCKEAHWEPIVVAENVNIPLPTIASVHPIFPKLLTVKNKAGEIIFELDVNGTVTVVKTTEETKDAAMVFWNTVKDQFQKVPQVGLIRDLTFLLTFIQGRGVWFSNPNEKVELYAWIGEIERRYGISPHA
jgi:hypothetical protein